MVRLIIKSAYWEIHGQCGLEAMEGHLALTVQYSAQKSGASYRGHWAMNSGLIQEPVSCKSDCGKIRRSRGIRTYKADALIHCQCLSGGVSLVHEAREYSLLLPC